MDYCAAKDIDLGSPPARGRGLKQDSRVRHTRIQTVAPRAGAWIETTTVTESSCGP